MPEIVIGLTIQTETALSLGAGGSSGSLADTSILRDGFRRPIIPGSQVKGKARYAAEQIVRSMGQNIPSPFDSEHNKAETYIRALFGSPDYRSPLRFATLTTTEQRGLIRPSVSINRRRGTAEEARLLFQETAVAGICFCNETAITGSIAENQVGLVSLLWAALCMTDRWGGAKSRGMGWSTVAVTVIWDREQLSCHQLETAFRTFLEDMTQ